jgi:hypothetical protein
MLTSVQMQLVLTIVPQNLQQRRDSGKMNSLQCHCGHYLQQQQQSHAL